MRLTLSRQYPGMHKRPVRSECYCCLKHAAQRLGNLSLICMNPAWKFISSCLTGLHVCLHFRSIFFYFGF